MSIIKSFSVGNGDMFYIKHNSDHFTIIDCNYESEGERNQALSELESLVSNTRGIIRFISTHPDEDHIHGLRHLDQRIGLPNFYCSKNKAKKPDPSDDFQYYCQLRDSDRAFYFYKDCKRKWLNDHDDKWNSSGIEFLWPIPETQLYQQALLDAERGEAFNNLSPIFTYSLSEGVTAMWMGDIGSDFLEKIKDYITWNKVDILFAPHHGRDSGKVPEDILRHLDPKLIVIGEAPSEYLNYYKNHNTITQNQAKDITFSCLTHRVDVYVSNLNYQHRYFLTQLDEKRSNLGKYIGSFKTHD